MEKLRVKDLIGSVDISKTYASDILAGKQRPSRPLAIHIFRKTGWRHPLIADLTDEQMAMLETIEPWRPATSLPTGRAA